MLPFRGSIAIKENGLALSYFFQMQRLADPIRHMSFRDFSWEIMHEVWVTFVALAVV